MASDWCLAPASEAHRCDQTLDKEHEAMSSRGYFIGAAILTLGLLCPDAPAQSWQLRGRGGQLDLGETPIVVSIKVPVPAGAYSLSGANLGESIPAVVFSDGQRHMLAAILPRVPAREPFALTMKPQVPADTRANVGIRIRDHGPDVEPSPGSPAQRNEANDRKLRNLLVTIDEHLFTEYRIDVGHKPFFFPLIGPTGDSFTRAYPLENVPGEDRDHPHQRSFWFTHGNVNGVDFWSETKDAGTIRETVRRIVVEGPVLARLWTRNAWLAPDGRKVCEDERTATFYRTKDSRIVDFDVTIHATDGPVTFGDTKEGMFGLRVASSMDAKKKGGGRITNANGLTDLKAWGQPSPWVDYVGPVQGKTVGIAILDHPESFRYPTTWHVRDYGLFAANPFGWHDFGRPDKGDYTVRAGQLMKFRYRVILHEGDTATIGMPALFQGYAEPPAVELEAD
jgi:hypothetical protein